jgi:DNA ligase-4
VFGPRSFESSKQEFFGEAQPASSEHILITTHQYAEDYISPLSIAEVDNLLEELASHSGYSDISVRANARATRRPKSTIIRALYRSLSPLDASFLTQIILKDLRPLLYPLADTHYTVALKSFNSVAVTHLSKVWLDIYDLLSLPNE